MYAGPTDRRRRVSGEVHDQRRDFGDQILEGAVVARQQLEDVDGAAADGQERLQHLAAQGHAQRQARVRPGHRVGLTLIDCRRAVHECLRSQGRDGQQRWGLPCR
mgnify:CR=1 FL=1